MSHRQGDPRLAGAEIVVAASRAEGVDTIWGYPGGAVLPIYDALAKAESIEHILVRHEQAAVHAADGYARATGRPGVALVTSGPGVTNAITGIATAYFDSIPLVVITGNVPTDAMGEDAFQECDTIGITRPVVKHNFLVRDVANLAITLKKAFHIACTGRPGPVVVDVPKDVALATYPFFYPESVPLRSYRPHTKGHPAQIRTAAALIASAQKPYIYTGGGVIAANASHLVKELAEVVDAPVTNTLMGLGGFPGTDRRFVGMPGMHGTLEANMTMHECDVLVAIGVRFDDRVIGNTQHFASQQRKIIHIDIDPASIGKRVKVDVPIVGDVKQVLVDLLEVLKHTMLDRSRRAAWWCSIDTWRARQCLAYSASDLVIKPQFVIQKLWEATHGQAILCSDVGQHQMWAAQLYPFEAPRQWINSGGLGTMGVGLPYAMGAKRAFPEKDVITITGDGSIQMCIQELSTCRQYHFPIKIVSLNNGYLGMVKQLQHVHYGSRYSQSYMDALPDFVALARAYGHSGFRIERPADVEPVIREALQTKDRLVFMDFVTDPAENVWPMVPSGAALTDMLLTSRD
ncbi:biosynthetic-type acetolactate synthase large subunit [Paraburkholderia sp. SARCC-3016]|uniref:biosynthetic-type acetolactate synthase large subunit n=1 Tax=Paraburkholderia sp. SARCC-3016 TaxID=3058611 RepID=UPI0028083DF6|nr:biosynthetic-type acetolactate synthase large subunit [Paraburkholderia sp. SARCC-3016]MDQ7982498.1 biosynthetic-type acetolactate synthase large subunit [Paraburkholderia sp. SARCC-3016]